MDDLISRKQAVEAINRYGSVWMEYTEDMSVDEIAERALKASKQSMVKILHDLSPAQPNREYIEQIKWERDTAIQQLKELGYGFGEKIRTDVDTISRQAAIDRINKQREHLCPDIYPQDTIGDAAYRICAEFIERLPSAQPEQRWIPVSERMPEPRIDVWCNSDMGQMVGYYDEYAETWYGRDYLELIVTAWMPLPEPYKAESEGEK